MGHQLLVLLFPHEEEVCEKLAARHAGKVEIKEIFEAVLRVQTHATMWISRCSLDALVLMCLSSVSGMACVFQDANKQRNSCALTCFGSMSDCAFLSLSVAEQQRSAGDQAMHCCARQICFWVHERRKGALESLRVLFGPQSEELFFVGNICTYI